MKTTIRVIFLDIGGVILSNGWDHLSRQKAAENFGFSYDEMEKRHQCFFNIFETGGFTLDEYLDRVVFYHSQNFTKQEFKAFMFSQSVELPLMLPWLRKWKKEIEIPVFSANNEARELNEYRIRTFSLHGVFDGFFSSCHLGFRKPDPRFFRAALSTAQVLPSETLYLDDRPQLVDAAKKLNIQAFLHQNFEKTKIILEKFIKNKSNYGKS